MNHNRIVKFIMPVHSDLQYQAKKATILDICKNEEWNAILPSYDTDDGHFSLSAMKSDIVNSRMIIADISMSRPSCYYELGVAESLGAIVNLIARTGTEIHQTTNRNSVEFYEGIHDFRQAIQSIIRNTPTA